MRLKAKLKADRVRRFLVEKNLSQKWLTIQLKTSSGYMSQLMNGSRYPSPGMRQKIMDALEIGKFNELFSIKK